MSGVMINNSLYEIFFEWFDEQSDMWFDDGEI
jgi:hypothetical protein